MKCNIIKINATDAPLTVRVQSLSVLPHWRIKTMTNYGNKRLLRSAARCLAVPLVHTQQSSLSDCAVALQAISCRTE